MKKILLLADVNSSHTRKWAEGISSLGYETAIFSLSKPENDWYKIIGIKLLSDGGNEWNDFPGNDLSKLSYLNKLSSLRRAIKSFAPDILHAHYATSYGLLGALSGKKPYLISVWGSDVFDFPKRSFVHRRVLKWIFSKANMLLSTSKIMQKEIALYSNKEIRLTPFGIDTDVFKPLPKNSDDSFTIGIIKKLEPHYGIDYLIRAFRIVADKFPGKKIQLIITGDGFMMSEYKNLAGELGLSDRITFTGRIPQDEVPAMHNRFDLFVCPSLQESFGVSVLEASACEVPVIVSNVGGLPEVVVEGKTGLMVSQANTAELAVAISYFITNPAQLTAFGKNGRKFVCDNYDWKKNLNQINDIYSHT